MNPIIIVGVAVTLLIMLLITWMNYHSDRQYDEVVSALNECLDRIEKLENK